jgi:hypothetical protein
MKNRIMLIYAFFALPLTSFLAESSFFGASLAESTLSSASGVFSIFISPSNLQFIW